MVFARRCHPACTADRCSCLCVSQEPLAHRESVGDRDNQARETAQWKDEPHLASFWRLIGQSLWLQVRSYIVRLARGGHPLCVSDALARAALWWLTQAKAFDAVNTGYPDPRNPSTRRT